MQRYPSSIHTHEVPGTGTAGFLPYRCFLGTIEYSNVPHSKELEKMKKWVGSRSPESALEGLFKVTSIN